MRDYSFRALGGGDEVGASCYVLRMGSNHIMLDAGIRTRGGSPFPDLGSLTEDFGLDGLHELDALFISHAHIDHVGALPSMRKSLGNVHIYSSPATPDFIAAQYEDIKNAPELSQFFTEASNNLSMASDYIIPVKTGETIHLKDIDATFLHAGHIPGAVMTLLEDDRRRVLYTGDFLDTDQFTVKGADIPEDLGNIDTLICESTLAYNSYNVRNELNAVEIFSALRRTGRIYLVVKSVGRAAEVALAVNACIPEADIWIDASCMAGCRACERYGVKIFGGNIRPLEESIYPEGIIIQSFTPDDGYSEFMRENELGLYNHAGRAGILKLIAKTNPKKVIFVHGVPERAKGTDIFDDIRGRFGNLVEVIHARNEIELAI